MRESITNVQQEERQIRERIGQLQLELEGLQARLDIINREREERPRARNFRTDFRIVATPGFGGQDQLQPQVPARPKAERPRDPLEELRRSPRGTALFAPALLEGRQQEVALWVQAEPGQLAQLGRDREVEFRAGLFTLAEVGVPLVPILVRVGPDDHETIYEVWANNYAAGMGTLLQALATQESIAIDLYGDGNHPVQTLRVPNELQAFAGEAQRLTSGTAPLSEDAFHQARQVVYRQYPTLRALWKALKS